MALRNFPEDHPYLEFARKTARRMNRSDPLQAPFGEPAEEAERNACHLEFPVLRQAHGAEVRLSFVVPPGEKILLLQAMGRERVIDDGRGFVPKMLAPSRASPSKFRVPPLYFRSRSRTQIRAKSPVLLKFFLTKSHVASEGFLGQLTWL